MATNEAQLRLDMLGPPEVHLGERQITFPTRKTFALLIYLALEGGQQPRELLATMLWPESSSERNHASLRNILGHLQSALRQPDNPTPTNYLSVTHNALALDPDTDVLIDLDVVERAYTVARTERSSRTIIKDAVGLPILQAAAACNRGDFLSGFSLGDAPGFDDWATIQREAWRRRMGLILDRLSEIQFAQGDFNAAAETASSWISLDGLNEVAYRRKMRTHFAAGERGQALDTYQVCRAILDAELGIQPEPDTEALAERIRTQAPILQSAFRPQQPNTPVTFLEKLFAGRTAEHQMLAEHYETASKGQPCVIVLRGDIGIGKTRLARAFMAWAAAQGACVLEGRAFESSSRMSYQPLIESFRPLLDRAGRSPELPDEPWLEPLSRLLPELRGRDSGLPPSHSDAEGTSLPLFESLASLTLALAEQSPLVLFLDDLQWADSATLDWSVYAARRWKENGTKILLLVGLRSESLQVSPHHLSQPADWLAHMEREIEPAHLVLGPLGEQDTMQLMTSLLAPSADDFARWIYNETRGQPFYLMETLKDLLERRALHPKRLAEAQWVFEVDSEHDLGKTVRVPSTVRAVILSRLNRLSPNAFGLLAAGAILDPGLTFERMCVIAHIAADSGLPALDELVSGQLLLENPQAESASIFSIAHSMIRDVVYTEAGDARRRLFHQRAFRLFETEQGPASVLALHALAAGLSEEAFQYSLAAGQQAMRLSATREAIAHFEKAHQLAHGGSLTCVGDESTIRDLYSLLGQAYEMIGDHDQALVIHNELQRLGPQPS